VILLNKSHECSEDEDEENKMKYEEYEGRKETDGKINIWRRITEEDEEV
jgi:hypothetical protein